MKQTPPNGTAEQQVREIRRQTQKKYSAEEKIRIVIFGLRGEWPKPANLLRLDWEPAPRIVRRGVPTHDLYFR